MASGEVEDTHQLATWFGLGLSALRAGLKDDITDQGADRFGRFPASVRGSDRRRAISTPIPLRWRAIGEITIAAFHPRSRTVFPHRSTDPHQGFGPDLGDY